MIGQFCEISMRAIKSFSSSSLPRFESNSFEPCKISIPLAFSCIYNLLLPSMGGVNIVDNVSISQFLVHLEVV
jgi:hypothetical protein